MNSAPAPLLHAEGLAVWRGERCLVRDLGLALHAGDLVWLRGPNGAGKTSLLRVLAGLATAETGHITWQGRPLAGSDLERLADLAWLGHLPGLKRGLTIAEAMDLEESLAGRSPDAGRRDAALAEFGLAGLGDRPVEQLSAGQRRRVALARLALNPARLWLLDEPYTHLDVEAIAVLGRVLAAHLDRGGAVIMVSHQPPEVPGHPVRELLLGGRVRP